MPKLRIGLAQRIHEIADHAGPKAPSASIPLQHYQQSVTESRTLLDYFDRKVGEGPSYAAVRDRHFARLHGMVMVNLIECLERYFKEAAAVCIDQIAPHVLDDRFSDLKTTPAVLRAHFEAGTFGLALCEPQTWLDCGKIDERFRKLLADPYEPGNFHVLGKQTPRAETLSVVWQLRHSMVHNVGVLTRSDASKLTIMLRRPVQADRVLEPTRKDLRFLTQFLDETADDCNRRIGVELAELLTTIHQSAPLFDAAAKANELSRLFMIPLRVAGALGSPSPLSP